jgi:hypothetical protein
MYALHNWNGISTSHERRALKLHGFNYSRIFLSMTTAHRVPTRFREVKLFRAVCPSLVNKLMLSFKHWKSGFVPLPIDRCTSLSSHMQRNWMGCSMNLCIFTKCSIYTGCSISPWTVMQVRILGSFWTIGTAVSLHFVPFHFVPGHFVQVTLSPGHFVSDHFVPGHFVPWSLCPW